MYNRVPFILAANESTSTSNWRFANLKSYPHSEAHTSNR